MVLTLLGCGKSGGTEDKTKTAEHLLTTIFSADEAMVDSFRQISGQEDLDAWAQKYFGDDMTEDGLQEFAGSLLLKETDGKWLVHDITKK